MKSNPHCIIFGPDGRNALGLARSLGEAGFKNIQALVLSTPRPYQVIHSKYIQKYIVINNLLEGLKYLKQNSVACSKNVGFVFTTSDDAQVLLDDHYDSLKDSYYFGNCGSQSGLKKWFNKENQINLAIECGFTIPLSEEVQCGQLPKTISYPIITKAIDSLIPGWKNNVHICYNEIELKEAYTKIRSEKIILQEYVEREYETKFDTVIYNGTLLKDIPQCFDYEFSDASYGNHHVYKALQNLDLLDKAEKMLKYIDFQGLVQIEFMKGKNGKLYFLEINFRHSGVGYLSTCCGVNLPKIYVDSVYSNKLCADSIIMKKLPIQTINEYSDFQQKVRK